MKLPDEENWLSKVPFDPRTPEQKMIDLESKVNDLSELVLRLHALTDQLRDIVINRQVADSSVKGDN